MKIRSVMDLIVANWPAKILAFAAAVLLFVFNRMNNMIEKDFELPLEIILPKGFLIAAPFQEKVNLTIKGDDEEALDNITMDDFRVFLDFSDLKNEGAFKLPVRYTRRGPALNSSVFIDKVEPSEIQIVLEREVIKSVPINPVIKGEPKIGYALINYTFSPHIVSLRGPRSRIEIITGILTDEIDLSGKSSNFTQRINLRVPDPLVSIKGEEYVEFQATIREVIVTRLYSDLPVRGINLHKILLWEQEEVLGYIMLEGPALFMDMIESEDLMLVINFDQVQEPGIYTMQIIPSVPSGLVIKDFEPKELQVILSNAR